MSCERCINVSANQYLPVHIYITYISVLYHIYIRYIFKENGGLHTAYNVGIENTKTELFVCIDSDDWMPDDAVEKILNCWRENGNDQLAGLIGLDVTQDGNVIGVPFPEGMKRTTLQGFYEAGGSGDKKLVYRTDVITSYPEYPLFEGERYVGLGYKYMLIDQDYELAVLNEPLVIVEYQQDGSSFNMFKQYWRNPRGMAFYRKTEMLLAHSLKRKLMVCTHYVSSSIISRNWRFIQESPKKLMTVLCIPSGVALYLLIRHKVKNNSKMNINR